MVIFRCTRALLERLPQSTARQPVTSTTALGDWYFKLLFTRPQRLLLGVSEKSRLPVVVPASELGTMVPRFIEAFERVLHDLGVSDAAASHELTAMKDLVCAKTVDRHVLGSLNEFAFAVQWARQDRPSEPLHALSLSLAGTPILALKDFPDRMTRRLLESRVLH